MYFTISLAIFSFICAALWSFIIALCEVAML